MSIWKETAVLGLYTLSPTHYGTGQTTGAIDLPIARDAATGLPVLPASGIKGVLRDVAERETVLKNKVADLFGPSLKVTDVEDGKADSLAAGRLAFTEARLIAYPVRSLSRPFLHVTCPLILEGFARTLRATEAESLLDAAVLNLGVGNGVRVADKSLGGQPVVLEDLIYAANEVSFDGATLKAAQALATLIPETEKATRKRFIDGLAVVPDSDFAGLMQSAVPVQARVQLTGGKTTDKWTNQSGVTESGNLWYEETLPSDCLFVALIGERRVRMGSGRTVGEPGVLQDLITAREAFAVVQIGGNETTGQGLCLGSLLPNGGIPA